VGQALHLQPGDKAILYNIAMIQQKAAEMLFALPPTKRTLIDLQAAIAQAEHGQRLFAALAADKASVIPYPREIADQRRKYGESLLRKAPEHVATQQQHEDEQQARLTAARQKRQEDKNRQQQLEV
jgi:RNA polymerase-associated protein CTR9